MRIFLRLLLCAAIVASLVSYLALRRARTHSAILDARKVALARTQMKSARENLLFDGKRAWELAGVAYYAVEDVKKADERILTLAKEEKRLRGELAKLQTQLRDATKLDDTAPVSSPDPERRELQRLLLSPRTTR